MHRKLLLFILVLCLTLGVYGAITVTSPSSADVMASPDDYSALSFQDVWDMNEQTDLGYYIYDTVSDSKSNLTGIDFSNGIFSATSTNTLPNISILDTGNTGTCYLGKIGRNYKIDADKYTKFAIRMKTPQNHDALFYWSRNTIYNDQSYSGIFSVYSGWRIYIIDIPSLGYTKVPSKSAGYSWSGDIDSLRLDPGRSQGDFEIDWIRLVENDNDLYRTIQWTGNSDSVDIYLDDDANEGNGTLGAIATNVSGSSYNFFVGALMPGTNYYVGIKNSSGGSLAYSAGYYRINDIPTMTFTAPSEEGGNDYADVELGDAFDFNSTSDFDLTYRVNNAQIANVSAENLAGESLGTISVYKGTSAVASGNVGDPVLYHLLWWGDYRGHKTPIDTSKYRILVWKMGLKGKWDINAGSIARVVWKLVGEGDNENVSADILIRHKEPNLVMNTIIADLTELPLETDGGGSPSTTGWTGMAEGFRIDPHEFPSAYDFYIQEVKLAAFERADASYDFQWNYVDSYENGSSLALYRDSNNSGFNGTLIASGIDPADRSYTWNCSGVAEGTYYIYAVYSDGMNTNKTYARWPIVIDHTTTAVPTISLNKTSLTFSASGGNSQTFTVGNSGTGTLNWTAGDNASWMSLSPTSGTNSGTVTVTVNRSGLSGGTYTGTITVTDGNATNSPQTISVTLQVSGGGSGSAVIDLSRDELYYGGTKSGIVTGAQTFLVNNTGTGTMYWTASDDASWLNLSPSSGTNSGVVTATATVSGMNPGTYTATITVASGNATNSPQTIPVTLTVYSNSGTNRPIGYYSTPTDGSTVTSSIAVTGWVVDDIEVESVKIYNGSVYVGDAVFVDGARGDVEDDYPGYPKNYMAGWGYMLLTNFLPNGGNGWYAIKAVATDAEGHQVTLGTKNIYCDNNNAVKPFGAIDTPAQGGVASGSKFLNWGWALTPQPKYIPTDGSTLSVWVNGIKIGTPTYNMYRSDIASLFPGYYNSNGAVGLYLLNTTPYDNGVHNIHWLATDSGNKTDGIGSRYFTVQNTGADVMNNAAVADDGENGGQVRRVVRDSLPRFKRVTQLGECCVDRFGVVEVGRGYDDNMIFTKYKSEKDGVLTVSTRELQRVVVRLDVPVEGKKNPNGMIAGFPRYVGYMQVGKRLRPLPVGSTLDAVRGVFYWQPGHGFVGDYSLVFHDRLTNRYKPVTVSIKPMH